MKKPNFMVGPPGTGKTSEFITKKYKELLTKYSHTKIIILSHTNVAADEIRDDILELPEVKEKGLTKKSFKYKICTIHSYCKSKALSRDVFSYEDHISLCIKDSRFKLQRISASDFEGDKHKFYKYISFRARKSKILHRTRGAVIKYNRDLTFNSYLPYFI